MIPIGVRLFLAQLWVLCLTMLPLPAVLQGFSPPWVLFLVLYIQFFQTHLFRVFWVFGLGLCLDVFQSSVLGEHALALLLTCWFADGRVQRFYFFTLIQQMLWVTLLGFTYQAVLSLSNVLMGYSGHFFWVLIIAIFNFISWPWVRMIWDYVFKERIRTHS